MMLTPHTHSPPQQKPSDALLTRHKAAEYVRDDLGRPLSFSTLTKLCALGEGPPVAEYWGRRPLYSREDLRRWAETRGRQPHNEPTEPTATQREARAEAPVQDAAESSRTANKPTGKSGRQRGEATAGA
jgi:hypothetical protein